MGLCHLTVAKKNALRYPRDILGRYMKGRNYPAQSDRNSIQEYGWKKQEERNLVFSAGEKERQLDEVPRWQVFLNRWVVDLFSSGFATAELYSELP